MQSFTLEFRVITDFIGYNEWFKDFGEYRIEDTINGMNIELALQYCADHNIPSSFLRVCAFLAF